jgi:hypothetical protein
MELLEVLITLPLQTVTVPAGATTGTVSVPTTADTIAEPMRPYYCSGTASATGTINDNDASNCSHDRCFGY